VEANDAGRIKYLKTSIAPMVARLLATHSKREVRRWLGLQYEVADTTRTRITKPRY
jgi:hypothetical protein